MKSLLLSLAVVAALAGCAANYGDPYYGAHGYANPGGITLGIDTGNYGGAYAGGRG